MVFESLNELEKFSFEDCQIKEVKFVGKDLIFTVEALIVLASNSQNSNYTDSYADETTIVLRNASVENMLEEGYRVYDADDKLLSETPDKEIDTEKALSMLPSFKEAFLFYAVKADEGIYEFEIDTGELDASGQTDPYLPTYLLKIKFSEVSVSWDRYLNRVSK